MKNGRLVAVWIMPLLIMLGGVTALAESTTVLFHGEFVGTQYGTLQSGIYSMRFAIFDAGTAGRRVWPQFAEYEEHPLVIVSGGTFEVELGSMGQPVVGLAEREGGYYVQVWVCQPAGFQCPGFEALPTRLPLTSPTYSFIGTPLPGEAPQEDDDRQATTASSGGVSDAWLLEGNAGTSAAMNFLGTTDNVALTLRVNDLAALRLEPDSTSPNLIGGHYLNSVSPGAFGATISGGGDANNTNRVTKEFGSIGGGTANRILGQHGTIAGGYWNEAYDFAVVGGGQHNSAALWYATVSGGYDNTASGNAATVAGGKNGLAGGVFSAVAGGFANRADGYCSFAAGGEGNRASGEYSFAAGFYAMALHEGCFVWADGLGVRFESTEPNQFFVRATGGALFNLGTTQFGMIIASGASDFSSSVPSILPVYSYCSLLVVNERTQRDAVGVYGHAGGAVDRYWIPGQVGVVGTAGSGHGVVGITSGTADDAAGGRFTAGGPSGKTFAVYGENKSFTEGSAGAYFEGQDGLVAEAESAGTAVLARVRKSEFGDAEGHGVHAEGGDVGVYGEPRAYLTERMTTPTYGIYGKSDSPFGYGVYSEGNSHVDGTLTWRPVLSYISVGPVAFAASAVAPFTLSSHRQWTPVTAAPREDCGQSVRSYDPTARELYFAQLQLPHGARLRAMDFHYSYAQSGHDSSLRLARSDFSGNVTFLAEIETKGGALTSSINHTVDNSTGFYYLFVALDCYTTLHGAVISYEVGGPY
jgi:hypothetical protein